MIRKEVSYWPLPEGVVDVPMNRAELADYMAVSVNTIDAWVKAGMPVEQEGGNGKAYVFMLGASCQWKQDRDEFELSRKTGAAAAIAIRQQELFNLSDDQLSGHVGAKEHKLMMEAAALFNRECLARRQLCKIDEVSELIESLFLIVSESADAMPDKMERELGLTPEQSSKVVDLMDGMLKSMVAEIDRSHLEEFEDEAIGKPSQVLI